MLKNLAHILIQSRIAGLVSGKLLRASSLMLLSTVGGGILGYGYQVLMGRMLSVADYGIFIALMTFTTIAGVPLGTLGMIVSRCVSGYRAVNEPNSAAAMYWWLNQRMLGTVLAMTICVAPFTPWVSDYFHLESVIPVMLLLSVVFTMSFAPINIAYLQAQQNFNWLAIHALALHGLKIFFCAIFLFAGYRLNGALVGVVLATLASWLLTYIPLRKTVRTPSEIKVNGSYFLFSGTISVLIANLAFVVMTQLDIILVNYYYDTYDAGVYAAAAILGKAVMYLPAAIAIAIFPMVAENEALNQGSAGLFVNSMALTAVLSGAGALLYYLFGSDIINLFYGDKYQGASELLQVYGFAMMPMTLVMVAEHFLIAKGRVVFAYVMLFGIPFVFLAAEIYHNSLMNMVQILLVCGWGLVLAGFGVIGSQYWWGRQIRNDK